MFEFINNLLKKFTEYVSEYIMSQSSSYIILINDLKSRSLSNSEDSIIAAKSLLGKRNAMKYLSFHDVTKIIYNNREQFTYSDNNIKELKTLLKKSKMSMYDLAIFDSANAELIIGSRLANTLDPKELALICKDNTKDPRILPILQQGNLLKHIINHSRTNPLQHLEIKEIFTNDPVISNIIKERNYSFDKENYESNPNEINEAYERFGLNEITANTVVINKAYRQAALKNHPDKGGRQEDIQADIKAVEVIRNHRDREKGRQR